MYELTCPFCKATTTSSFVRVGAVALCRQCHHQFSIKAENVQRRGTPPAPAGPAGDPVAVPDPVPGDETAFPSLPVAGGAGAMKVQAPVAGDRAIPSGGQVAAAAPSVAGTPAGTRSAVPSNQGPRSPRFGSYDISPLTWLIAGAILASAAWGTWLVVQHARTPASPPPSTTAPVTQPGQSAGHPIR